MKGLHLTADLRGVDPGRLLMTDTAALAAACGDAVHLKFRQSSQQLPLFDCPFLMCACL